MRNKVILYKGEPISTSTIPEPAFYMDSDSGGDRDKRQSTSGCFLTLCGGAVSWKTRKQDIVALSMMEVEYIALTETSKKVICMCRLLHEIENRNAETFSTNEQRSYDASTNKWEEMEDVDPLQSLRATTTIFVDNQGAMKLATNPQFYNRT